MTVALQNESHGKTVQATFFGVGENCSHAQSSDAYLSRDTFEAPHSNVHCMPGLSAGSPIGRL
jgi:hypothetical protein